MNRLFLPLFLVFCPSIFLNAQHTGRATPRLIVGITVDQMRYDFLYKYESSYGEGGFKRLLKEGFSCENTHFNYVPTYTGPGHAAIYTGTTPSVNGIIANEWWDSDTKKERYVTSDVRYSTVGGTIGKVGQHSPAVLLSSTITDELRMSNSFRSKVVGVCLKDRGSILPAGHIPNAAYWFDDVSGNWITSTYYPDSTQLPQWVQDFNAKKRPELYLSAKWDKLAGKDYSQSFADWKHHEDGKYFNHFQGEMPYDLQAIRQKIGNVSVIRFTPFGNSLTLDFALDAIQNMEMGKDEWTDFLCLSFSSTDYIGHQFGVHAEETQDAYLRLDRDIERLLKFLDEQFGKDQVLVFLTADHGAAETPEHLAELRMPTGVFDESKLEEKLEKAIELNFGSPGNYIHNINNQQIWLNWDAIAGFDMNPVDVADVISQTLRSMPGVYDVFSRDELEHLPFEYPFAPELRRGIHPRRSGEILYQLDPAWHADDKYFKEGGTTHGSSYPYDTHVPLLWYGGNIKPGVSFEPVSITDIAPTLSAMLRIMEPNGSTGKIIQALFR
ncbi:MAG: alkaline phosphatase family protein [Saprospiraceae bacterium]|nr:alkaline phosphatase family protein [Saprospiraceae bacterium]